MPSTMLSAVKTGITRLRVKGGASADSLYDLVNGYVTAARTIAPRPGSEVFAQLPAGTIGLQLFNGTFQVFSDSAITDPVPDRFNVNVLSPPADSDPDNRPSLVRIWKAEPFMGGLYVVAEWSDRSDRAIHYWLKAAPAGSWEANKVYLIGEQIVGSNGLVFEAQRLSAPGPTWAPGTETTAGAIVEPTTYNGYRYVADEVYGEPARTGTVEPLWVAETGAIVVEEADAPPPAGTGGSTGGSSGSTGGYGNPGGSCVAVSMLMSSGLPAQESVVGSSYRTHDPIAGFRSAPLVKMGDPILQPCVRMRTRKGCVLECSKSTPFTMVGAPEDSQEFTMYAPDMLGEEVLVNIDGYDGVDTVASIIDIGQQWVVPLDFGGISFAAGAVAGRLIYSHNMRKGPDSYYNNMTSG